jgi:hypothetical protein
VRPVERDSRNLVLDGIDHAAFYPFFFFLSLHVPTNLPGAAGAVARVFRSLVRTLVEGWRKGQ